MILQYKYTQNESLFYPQFKYLKGYNLWYRTQLWQSDESSSFFFIKTGPHFSSSGRPFCPHMIFHIPFESESHAEQDGVYRF